MLITVCYLMYPTITRKVFDALSCRADLLEGEDNTYLWSDLSIGCVSIEHLFYVLLVSIPALLLFVIGFPAISLCGLKYRLRNTGWNNDTTMFRYAMLLSGYTHERWYWEGVIFFRKTLLIMTAVFFKNYGTQKQFIFASLVIVMATIIQVRERPFANVELNTLENYSLGTLFVSLYFGLFFFWDLLDDIGRDVLGITIIGLNSGFMLWLCGSILREYLARHLAHASENRGKFLKKFQTNNPFLLCMFAMPCFILLICFNVFDVFVAIITCNGRCGPFALEAKKAKKARSAKALRVRVVPKGLLKKQRLQLKEVIKAQKKSVPELQIAVMDKVRSKLLEKEVHGRGRGRGRGSGRGRGRGRGRNRGRGRGRGGRRGRGRAHGFWAKEGALIKLGTSPKKTTT